MRSRILLAAILALAAGVPAQLSGIYSIDNTTPTGGTNFTSFIDAAAALASQGVVGPVAFVVSPGSGPYPGFAIPSPITGSSSTNLIIFQAAGPVAISGAAATFTQTIHLGTTSVTSTTAGPAYITLDGFEVTGAPSGAGIIAGRCDNIIIRNCRVHTCGSGICFAATTNSVAEDNEVFVVGNTVGTPGSATYAGGISSYYNSHGCTIQRNKVHDCTGNGIFLGSSGSATAPSNNVIVNNMVWNTPGLGTYPGGIAIRRSGSSVIANNSVWMPPGSTFGGIHQMGGAAVDPQPAEISNNIVKHDGSGACFRFELTTVIPAMIFDYNLYDPGPMALIGQSAATNISTLAAWQALTAPSLSGKEVNTLAGSAGFLASADLHITPASLGFNNGSTVAQVTLDIDLETRPIAGIPDRGADETPATGLFASFSGTPVTGAAPLTVRFTDNSFTSSAGGLQTWAWDFQDDGINDAFVQNPTWTYSCPGSYSVRLTVTDGQNPPSTYVRTNHIAVSAQIFSMLTSGGGVGDLTINPVPAACYPAATHGYTLASFSTAPGGPGTGPFLGLYPDFVTIQFILAVPLPGHPIHFVVTGNLYPDGGPLALPAGTLGGLAGVPMDAVEVLFDASYGIVFYSNVSRVTL